MYKPVIATAKDKMKKTLTVIQKDLTTLRAGRANPQILDKITVDYYGSQMGVDKVASVTVPDARTVLIQPWEKAMIRVIETAIITANIGLTPSNNGDAIRLNIPPLTEERRRALVKQVKDEAERARVGLRAARRDAVEAFNYMMNLMREHVPDGTRIHYAITDGGKAPNVVPAKAQVLYYLRNQSRAVVADLKARAIKAAEGAALGTGTTMEYEVVSGNFERLYNQRLAEVLQKNLEAVGGVAYDEREKAFAIDMLKSSGITDFSVLEKPTKVLPLGCDYPTLRGVSSDVGNVTWAVPTASFRGATFVPAGLGHCWQFTSSGGTTIGTKGVMNVAKVMFFTAYDLYTQPSVVEEVQKEFTERRGSDFVFVPLIGDRNPPLDYRK